MACSRAQKRRTTGDRGPLSATRSCLTDLRARSSGPKFRPEVPVRQLRSIRQSKVEGKEFAKFRLDEFVSTKEAALRRSR